MTIELVDRTQKVFEIDSQIRKAELVGDRAAARAMLVDGLLESCLILREMHKTYEQVRAEPDPEAWQFFLSLKRQDRLDGFLDMERKFLSATALKSASVDLIVATLGRVVGMMIAQEGHLDTPWQAQLRDLTNLVCDKASREARDLHRLPLIRRVFLAAGGSTVAMLNLFPAPSMPIPPSVAVASVSLGTWLIAKAAEGTLDAWVTGGNEKT